MNDKTHINSPQNLLLNKPEDSDFSSVEYERFINSLTIKELLVYNKDGHYVTINNKKAIIVRKIQSGRSTYYCPYLQR